MHRQIVIVVSLGVLAVGGTVFWVARSPGVTEFSFVECPKCGKIAGYNERLPKQTCSKCGPATHMEPKAVKRSVFGRAIGPVLLEVNLVFAVLIFLHYYNKKRMVVEQEQATRHFFCPSCGQKLRYSIRRAGSAGQCPRCNDLFTFPDEDNEDDRRTLRATMKMKLEEGP